LHRFGDIAGFCAPDPTPVYSTPIWGMFSLHQIAHVGVSPHTGLKIFGREICVELGMSMRNSRMAFASVFLLMYP